MRGIIQIQGFLYVRIRDAKSHRVVWQWGKRNTIMLSAGDVVRSLVAQRATDPAASQLALGSMRFGTSDTTPTTADTDLWSEVTTVRKQLSDARKVNGVTGELTLLATLESAEGNGYTYAEAGLFTTGSLWSGDVGGHLSLFSRQVHPAQPKTVGQVFDYEWTLQFATCPESEGGGGEPPLVVL